jgi:ribosomal protein S27AE
MKYDARYNDTQTRVIWQAIEERAPISPRTHDAPVAFNRAQRRALSKYIRRKSAPMRRLQRETRAQTMCRRCGKVVLLSQHALFPVSPVDRIERCQCAAMLERKKRSAESAA